jgi:hypothetical protein
MGRKVGQPSLVATVHPERPMGAERA